MTKKTNFKGLEISDMKFERKKTNCSKEVVDSCGTRDCIIEVYKLGEDIIYAGGLCPKGNTDFNAKITPNYVLVYQNILNNHLKKYSQDIGKESEGERILIPRSLTFLNESGVFYTALYNNLGFDVCISPESNEDISELGKAKAHSEFCYPLILAHGHVSYLNNLKKPDDKILLADVISNNEKEYKFCPYVASVGNVIKGNLGLKKEEVLLPVLRLDDSRYPLKNAIHKDLQRVFENRFSKEQVNRAVEKAKKSNEEFLDEVYQKGEEIVERLKKKKERIFIGIGRGYTILDDKASSKVHELFSSNGLHFLPSYFIKPQNYNIDDYVENMYWYQGRRIIDYTLFSIDNNMFPVRLTNFNCGPDSLIHYHEEKLMNDSERPWLLLETDGHNSNAQFGTRIQAHNRVVEKYSRETKSKLPEAIKENKNLKDCIIGFPYMGDNSHVVAAVMRYGGIKGEVMPTATKQSQEIANKIVSTNTCRPFFFQVGDHLAWLESLKKKGIDPNKKAAIFMPSARGPCRFGQYSSVLRNIYRERGFGDVHIISPSSEDSYEVVGINPKLIRKMTIDAYKGIISGELLYNVLLRYRPYEKNSGDCERLYKESFEELVKLVERNASLKKFKKFLEIKAHEFEEILKTDEKRKPLVLVNGEIYVRTHQESNEHSIELLEKNGLEVILEPTSSWLDYVVRGAICKSYEQKEISQIVALSLKNKLINHIKKVLISPFKEQLKGRLSHDPFALILELEDNLIFNHAIEGESGISIGEAKAFIDGHIKINGIYHVGPLGCMQETLATSRIQALLNEKRSKAKSVEEKLIPFMDAVFGESASPNLESQIAIFAENCKLHKQLKGKGE